MAYEMNWETETVNMWLMNDEDAYHEIEDRVHNDFRNDESERVRYLAYWIEEYVDESNPLSDESSIFGDLLRSAIDNVDFYLLAEMYLDEFSEFENEE